MSPSPLLLIGGGGHALVLAEVITLLGGSLQGYAAPQPEADSPFAYLGTDETIYGVDPQAIQLVNALGSVGEIALRRRLYLNYLERGFGFATLCHPAAVISRSGTGLGLGLQVLAGAIIAPYAQLGDNVLVNTRAVVEHECQISDHCHIATAAVLCGGVRLGEAVHVGANATVLQGLEIGAGSVVAAGAVVTSAVPPGVLVAGIPAVVKKSLCG